MMKIIVVILMVSIFLATISPVSAESGILPGYGNLTPEEKKLAKQYPFEALNVSDAGIKAYTECANRFGSCLDDTYMNAFLHAYWNALMVKYIGENLAREFANAHENFPENDPTRKNMDLGNNHEGRRIGIDYKTQREKIIADKVYEAVKNGKMIEIVNGKLVPTKIPTLTQNPTLTNTYISPSTILLGKSFTGYYVINNPNSNNVKVGLGLSIRRSGLYGEIVDTSHDKVISVAPGTNTYSRTFTVPSSASDGSYDVALAIWSGTPGTGTQYATSGWKSNALTVSQPTPTPKKTPTPTVTPKKTPTPTPKKTPTPTVTPKKTPTPTPKKTPAKK